VDGNKFRHERKTQDTIPLLPRDVVKLLEKIAVGFGVIGIREVEQQLEELCRERAAKVRAVETIVRGKLPAEKRPV
jgi:hypothetical protein